MKSGCMMTRSAAFPGRDPRAHRRRGIEAEAHRDAGFRREGRGEARQRRLQRDIGEQPDARSMAASVKTARPSSAPHPHDRYSAGMGRLLAGLVSCRDSRSTTRPTSGCSAASSASAAALP